ncbi:hypothetical protein BH23PLA1_BH23PLA1_20880 [soil metagenome]
MLITVYCECGRSISAPPEKVNRQVRCPRCGQEVCVPIPAIETAFDLETIPEPNVFESQKGHPVAC